MKRSGGILRVTLALVLGVLCAGTDTVSAAIPAPGPKDGSVGVQGVIPSDPPRQGATIVQPANGATTNNGTVTVSGFCPSNLLVKIFDNGIFVGSATCRNNSYSVQISLFNGRNELEAHVFDALDQEGPVSNRVTVTFNDAQFQQFGSHMSITSQFARRGAQPKQQLVWPIVIAGGEGPYALSIDWGDGSPTDLRSVQFPGEVNLAHTYTSSGTYLVLIKGIDKNGTEAFLQVVAVISGNVSGQQDGNGGGVDETDGADGTSAPINGTILIASAAMIFIVTPVSFWLGRRYELAYLRQRIEHDSQA